MHNIFIYVFVSDTLVGKTMFRNVFFTVIIAYSGTAAPAYLLLVTLAVSRSGGYED